MDAEWDWCGCNHDYPCGCGHPKCVCSKDDVEVIHWRGGHWMIGCAFPVALKEREAEREACAKVAEACAKRNEDCPPTCKCGDGWHIAICIRGRGKADGPR
jgi:hypothetical protein